MRKRNHALALSVLPVLLLTGCGGAGIAGDAAPEAPAVTASLPPQIEGVILDVEGETSLVGGVPLVLDETGEETASDEAGSFSFGDVPEGDVTVSLAGAPSLLLYQRGSDDEAEDADDGCDRRERSVHIRGVASGEQIRLELRIADGRIVEARMSRRSGDGDHEGPREVEIEMRRTDANTDPDMEGEVELEVDADGCRKIEIEVENATPDDELEAVVVDPDREEESLGTVTVEPDGDAEWRLNTCDGDELPFGAETLLDLAGHGFEVRDAEGTALLRARLPELPPERDCRRIRGAARLRSLVDPVRGYVRYLAIVCRDEVRRQAFEIAALHLEEGQEVEFFLEDPDDPGTLASIGTVLANAHGVARVTFDTKDGDELPHGVETLRALIGMEIEVRNAASRRLLVGRVPPPLDG